MDRRVLPDYTGFVPEYCTCGAELPADARFCHKCGKPQRDEQLIEAEETAAPPPPPPAAAEASAAVNFSNSLAVRLGFLAALAANVFTFLLYFGCPLWLFGSGVLAAVWYGHRSNQPLTTQNGMRMGWITGLFSFMIFTVMFTFSFVAAVRSGVFERATREQLENLPFARGNVDAMLELLSSPAGMAMNLLVSLMVMFVVFTAFAVMGGAAGAKIAARRRG
jgi:hypothetical protein